MNKQQTNIQYSTPMPLPEICVRRCEWGQSCQKEGQGGRQGGRETREAKSFPSYCPVAQAGTAVGATVSL